MTDGVSGVISGLTLDPIFDAAGTLLTHAGEVLKVVVTNPILVLPLAMSALGMCCGLVGMLRRAR